MTLPGDEHALRGQPTMHETQVVALVITCLVRRLETERGLHRDVHGEPRSDPTIALVIEREHVHEREAADALHRDVAEPVVIAELFEAHHTRVVDLRYADLFAVEELGRQPRGGERFREDLDGAGRGEARGRDASSQVQLPRRTGSDEPVDGVPTQSIALLEDLHCRPKYGRTVVSSEQRCRGCAGSAPRSRGRQQRRPSQSHPCDRGTGWDSPR